MKVLTLHQPWATLIALGVKTIETRPNRTHVRGRIAIHAAAKKPRDVWTRDSSDPDFDPAIAYIYDKHDSLLQLDEAEDGYWWRTRWAGPLGAIVATADIYNCVPMIDADDERAHDVTHLAPAHCAGATRWYLGDPGLRDVIDVTAQVPYGHFAPGRWAWMLRDIEALGEPVPFRGGQGWSRSWDPN